MSGSSDNSAYIWNTTLQNSMLGRKPIATLQGHEAEVTCVEFSKVNSYKSSNAFRGCFAFECEKHNLAFSSNKLIIFCSGKNSAKVGHML